MSTTAAVLEANRRKQKQNNDERIRRKRKGANPDQPASNAGIASKMGMRPKGSGGNQVAPHSAPEAAPDSESFPDGEEFKTPTGAETLAVDDATYIRKTSILLGGPKTPWQRFLLWWVIDPRASRHLGYWDVATVLALFFVALVTPFGAPQTTRMHMLSARRHGSSLA